MCYDTDAAPPAFQPPVTAVHAEVVRLTSADGATFAAYEARPEQVRGPGVVILPDLRGLHAFYRHLAVRFAEQGHPAVAVDYFGRTATDDDRGPDFQIMAHVPKLTRENIQADLRAAIDRVGRPAVAVGFCMGGRNAFFAAAPEFGLAGVIGFYGVPGIAPPYGPGPTQHAHELAAPVLGLFGGADQGIPAEQVTEFGAALTAAGVEHELVTYPGAPHGFFDAAYAEHAAACADAWRRVLTFLGGR
ncbi:dienelactone hydrolase family protein [Nonomuraea sp. NN258]|uniref:dienelactone hydrolase family protein n=1 Tax=Nonomuraea antri TaxID=2730852 RepID=UPI001569D3AB|nr:dienelactone hydrolase family protein [Nonomuraea antri]NRQ33014.1 dienelactone hydrolase family protein [Nonomuraea antri]